MSATVAAPVGPSAFEYTATGVLGDQRKTMLSNKLHLRSELGKSKSHGHVGSQASSFTYGMANPPRDTGVAGALVWPQPNPESASKKKSTKKSDKAYGQPVRPSTPIHDVLSFKFQEEWIAQQRAAQLAKTKKEQVKKMPPGAYRENHTSELRAAYLQTDAVEDCPGWQMKKFADVHTNLDTFRSEEARQRAIKNQKSGVPVVVE